MMKTRYLFLLLALVMLLSGCGPNNDTENSTDIPVDRETTSLVIIAGKHANANNFSDHMMAQAESLMRKAVDYKKDGYTYTAELDLTLIVSDGEPRAEELTLNNGASLTTSADDEDLFLSNVESMLDAISNKLISYDVRGRESGVDLQGALNQARKILRTSTADHKHILILDTGICTEGNLDMRTLKLMDGTLQDVMDRVDANTFPNLEGISVTFLGLGNVAAPQGGSEDNPELEQRLEEFWRTYLEDMCGATLENDIVYAPSQGEPMYCSEDVENPYPYVPTVMFAVEKPKDDGEDVVVVDPDPILPPIFSAEIGFEPDSAEFRDLDEAMKVLKARAEDLRIYFEQNPGKIVYIVGSISRIAENEKPVSDNYYSKLRAQKIFEKFVNEFGFDEAQFEVIDAGSTVFSWRNNDEYIDGIEQIANKELNRLVALIAETDTERMQELIDAGEVVIQ